MSHLSEGRVLKKTLGRTLETIGIALIIQTSPDKIAAFYLNERKYQAIKLQPLISSVITWGQIMGFLVLICNIAELIWGQRKIYLHCIRFLDTEMSQAVEVLTHEDKDLGPDST